MKIKILSNDKGKILAAILPVRNEKRHNVETCGPVIKAGHSFNEIELPKGTNERNLPKLLAKSRVKRVKGEDILETLSDVTPRQKKLRSGAVRKR